MILLAPTNHNRSQGFLPGPVWNRENIKNPLEKNSPAFFNNPLFGMNEKMGVTSLVALVYFKTPSEEKEPMFDPVPKLHAKNPL